MAVVEERVEKSGRSEKVEKTHRPEHDDKAGGGLGAAIGWLPRKVGEGRSFVSEVRTELKKVTWPSKKEVYSTTLVVIATSIFFGFYLWGLDLALSRVLSLALKR